MYFRWLKDVFDRAVTDNKGLLSEWETISLMKKLNNQLSTVRVKQKIMVSFPMHVFMYNDAILYILVGLYNL